jgi:hypothetical protein
MNRPWDAVAWWELRRIPFNLVVFLIGVVTILIVEIVGDHFVKPGEDAIEPALLLIGVPIYAIAANLFYTLGWISELLWSGGNTERTAPFRRRVFRLGLSFSVFLTLLPAIVLPILWFIFGGR